MAREGSQSAKPEDRGEGQKDKRSDLLCHYVDLLSAGASLDREKIAAENPEIAEELLSYLELFEGLGRSNGEGEPLGSIGDYQLQRKIGRGGMGVVYEAWEVSMERRVALKVLPATVAADQRALMRFVREARLAGKLQHPNVVSVYGLGVKGDVPHYAMEYVEGETLAQILVRRRTAERGESAGETPTLLECDTREAAYYLHVAKLFAGVAGGLQHAHENGITHRDVKPSNLILDAETDQGGRVKGRLRILDFGLARLEGQESLTLSGDLVGTPLYMSPEQVTAPKIVVDQRTDVYSLGATLYETLTLTPPFRGKHHGETLSHILSSEPEPPRKRNSKIPVDLETITLKCFC